MKKILFLMLLASLLTGCSGYNPEDSEDIPVSYTMVGRYEDCGLIFDQYGEVWEYWEKGVADNVNVRIYVYDNGTPNDNKDDIILNIVEDSTLVGDASLYWLD